LFGVYEFMFNFLVYYYLSYSVFKLSNLKIISHLSKMDYEIKSVSDIEQN
jgi:hypothetical protein